MSGSRIRRSTSVRCRRPGTCPARSRRPPSGHRRSSRRASLAVPSSTLIHDDRGPAPLPPGGLRRHPHPRLWNQPAPLLDQRELREEGRRAATRHTSRAYGTNRSSHSFMTRHYVVASRPSNGPTALGRLRGDIAQLEVPLLTLSARCVDAPSRVAYDGTAVGHGLPATRSRRELSRLSVPRGDRGPVGLAIPRSPCCGSGSKRGVRDDRAWLTLTTCSPPGGKAESAVQNLSRTFGGEHG